MYDCSASDSNGDEPCSHFNEFDYDLSMEQHWLNSQVALSFKVESNSRGKEKEEGEEKGKGQKKEKERKEKKEEKKNKIRVKISKHMEKLVDIKIQSQSRQETDYARSKLTQKSWMQPPLNIKRTSILEKLKRWEDFFSDLEVSKNKTPYYSCYEPNKTTWFGFNMNMQLVQLWELVKIPLNLTQIYEECEVEFSQRVLIIQYLSAICTLTRSKQAIYCVKYFALGGKENDKGPNKKGLGEFRRTFGVIINPNDHPEACLAVSMMLASVLGVRAYNNWIAMRSRGGVNKDSDLNYFN